jgi:glycosyltransferase involved in cell wall biosynthesis
MNLLTLGKYYPPYRGGIETLTRLWCEGFAARGARVRCVVAHDAPRTVRETLHHVEVIRCARFGAALSTPIAPGYLIASRGSWDLIHAHFPNPLADLALLLAARRAPLVLTYHSDIVRQAGLMRLYQPLLAWLLHRATRIVVATPPQLQHSAALAPHRAKCEVIPFGLDLRRYQAAPAPPPEVVAARAATRGKPILLNVGRLVGYKGQRHLIEALPRLDAVAWIVGTGPLREELAALASTLGVADRVTFWGDVDDALLPALMHACDVFVLPSITPNEAFGLVQVEAMACGKPVVSCQLDSGVPFVNQHAHTGLVVPPQDSVALAEAVQRLLSDPSLAARLGRAAAARAAQEFALDVMVTRYWNLLQGVREAGRTA